jgi:hypothetical protein
MISEASLIKTDYQIAVDQAFAATLAQFHAELTRRYSDKEQSGLEAERAVGKAIECALRARAFFLAKEPKTE